MGERLADVCFVATVARGGVSYDVSTACTGPDGTASLQDVPPGAYTVRATSVPNGYRLFDDTAFTTNDYERTFLTVPVRLQSEGTPGQLVTVLYGGPETLPGACWSYTTNEIGFPGDTLVGPVCDDDGDGTATLGDVPRGSYCITVTPPPGYFRQDRKYVTCSEGMNGSWSWRVGFSPEVYIPTVTPVPPTPIPPPTPTPAPDDPDGEISVQNCAENMDQYGSMVYRLCRPVAAGVRFAVIQGGARIAEQVTAADGSLDLTLDERRPYQLRYLGGNDDATWVPAPGQDTLALRRGPDLPLRARTRHRPYLDDHRPRAGFQPRDRRDRAARWRLRAGDQS